MTATQRSKGIWPMTDSRRAIVSTGDHRYASSSTTRTKSQSQIPSSVSATHRPFIRKTSFRSSKASFVRRYYEWKNEHMYLGRYSIEKLLAFEEYQRKVSRLRVFTVIALTPLPALIIVLILAAIPLESPLLPATSNAAYFIQSWLSFSVVTFGMLLYIRCALALPENIYSHRECALIALLVSGANELIMFIVSVLWRFPVPLRDMLGIPTYLVFFVFFHVVILRTKLRHYYDRIRSYFPMYLAQLAIFFIFEGIAILFKLSPIWTKAGIAVAFPLVRTTLKHAIIRFSYSLEDISTEVSLCVVEVFGSLFQNVCLQTSRSLLVAGLIMLLDFIQAIVEVQMYMNHRFVVDGKHCVQTAVKIVKGALFPGEVNADRRNSSDSSDKHSFAKLSCPGVSLTIAASDIFSQPKTAAKATPRPHRSSKIACLASGSSTLDLGVIQLGVLDQELLDRDPKTSPNPEKMPKTRRSSIDDVKIAHRHHAKLLTQTLQLMYASEVLVFAEYAEFASACIYGLFTLILFHFPYAKYSLCFIGLSESEFWGSVLNCVVYTVLEGLTLIAFFVSVRRKFGISPLYQLAFVLEKYWMSVQGKMTTSLVLVFILHTVHQGTDLSLEFNWKHLLEGHNH